MVQDQLKIGGNHPMTKKGKQTTTTGNFAGNRAEMADPKHIKQRFSVVDALNEE